METPVNKSLNESFSEAEIVVVATPTALQPSPNIWSGTLATFQGVEYEVSRQLKGSGIKAKQAIVVLHPLVAKSATADMTKPNEAQLRASAFDSSKSYVVFLRAEADKLYCINENRGIVEATPEVIKALELLAAA